MKNNFNFPYVCLLLSSVLEWFTRNQVRLLQKPENFHVEYDKNYGELEKSGKLNLGTIYIFWKIPKNYGLKLNRLQILVDDNCLQFFWSVLASVYVETTSVHSISKYRRYETHLRCSLQPKSLLAIFILRIKFFIFIYWVPESLSMLNVVQAWWRQSSKTKVGFWYVITYDLWTVERQRRFWHSVWSRYLTKFDVYNTAENLWINKRQFVGTRVT